jgi:phage shock protein A
MAKEYRESEVRMLLEAHLDQLKKINEGIQGILTVQKRMEKELENMKPIKEEWPVIKLAITNTHKKVNQIDTGLKRIENKIDILDKQTSLVMPDHEKRITHLEAKPA